MKMKKLLSAMMACALLLGSLTACAPQKQKGSDSSDPGQVYAEVMGKMSGLKSLDVDTKISISMDAEDEAMKLDMDTKMMIDKKSDTDVDMIMETKLTRMGQDIDVNMYYTGGYSYVDMMGQKIKTATDVSKITEQVQSSTGITNLDPELLTDFRMEEVEGKRVIHYSVSKEKLNQMLKQLSPMMGDMLGSAPTDQNTEITQMEGIITLNQDNYAENVKINMSMFDKETGSAVSLSADANYNNPGQKVTITMPDLSEYKEVNSDGLDNTDGLI